MERSRRSTKKKPSTSPPPFQPRRSTRMQLVSPDAPSLPKPTRKRATTLKSESVPKKVSNPNSKDAPTPEATPPVTDQPLISSLPPTSRRADLLVAEDNLGVEQRPLILPERNQGASDLSDDESDGFVDVERVDIAAQRQEILVVDRVQKRRIENELKERIRDILTRNRRKNDNIHKVSLIGKYIRFIVNVFSFICFLSLLTLQRRWRFVLLMRENEHPIFCYIRIALTALQII